MSKQMSSYLEGIYIHKSHLIWLTHSHIEWCTSILHTCTDSCICTFTFQFVLRHARIFLDINSMRILELLHAHALACMRKWACMYTWCLCICGLFIFKSTAIHHQDFRWTDLWSYYAHMCASRWTKSRDISRSKCKARNIAYIWHRPPVQLGMSRMGSRVGKHNVNFLYVLWPKVSQRDPVRKPSETYGR